MNTVEIRPLRFPEAVLARPRMYTVGGSFKEVVAFLDGFYSGMAKVDLNAAPAQEWAEFREWLSRQLDSPEAEVFDKFFKVFKRSGHLQNLVIMIHKFIEEQP